MVDQREVTQHEQRLRKGGQHPEYVNMTIPSEPSRIRLGPGRGTASATKGSAWLMGTRVLSGSPTEVTYQAGRVTYHYSGTAGYFAITHSRQPGGTVDVLFTRASVNTPTPIVAAPQDFPFYSFVPGTLRIYALGPGTSQTVGKGSALKYIGFGSNGPGGAYFGMDLYPV